MPREHHDFAHIRRRNIWQTENAGAWVARWLEGKERSEDYARSTLALQPLAALLGYHEGEVRKADARQPSDARRLRAPHPRVHLAASWSSRRRTCIGPLRIGPRRRLSRHPRCRRRRSSGRLSRTICSSFALFIVSEGSSRPSASRAACTSSATSSGRRASSSPTTSCAASAATIWNVAEAVLLFTLTLFVAQTMGNLANWCIAHGHRARRGCSSPRSWDMCSWRSWELIALWMISLGINYKQGPWALFRNAVVMARRHAPADGVLRRDRPHPTLR